MAQDEEKTIDQLNEEADIAADYLEGLLDIVDYEGDIEMGVRNNRPTVQIVADDDTDIKHLIGRNGEVVDALQQLTRLAVQQKTGERSHLIVDVDGYLKRKRQRLHDIALDAIDEARHVADDGRHRVGLHRVVELDACRQGRPQLGHAAGQELAVVGVEGGLADPVDQALEGDAADQQLAAGARELVHGRMGRLFAGVHVHGATLWVCSNSVDRVLRSILPLGLRGSGPSRSSMTLGTM